MGLKKTVFKCVILWLGFVAQTQFTYAQKNVNFTWLQTKDGLSSNNVNAILKDKSGLMWFATQDGLNKYDGRTFKVYRHRANDSTSLYANDITALHEDKSGNLWIGTNGGYLSLYDRNKDAFISLVLVNRNSSVSSLCSDYHGKVWVATFGGLYLVDPGTRKVTTPKFLEQQNSLLSNKTVIRVFEDSQKRMWLGTKDGLFVLDQKKGALTKFSHAENDPQSLIGNEIKSIAEDGARMIWVGTSRGLSRLNADNETFKNYFHASDEHSITSNIIYSIAPVGKAELWLGTEEGLNVFNIQTGKSRHFIPDLRNSHSLSNKSVRAITVDRQGIYWLGLYQGGINKYDSNLSLFNVKQPLPFDNYGLRGSVVTSFAEDGKGDVYVGTDGGGLNRYKPKEDLFHHFDLKSPEQSGNKKLSVLSLEMDHNQQLWIGCFGEGLFKFQPSNNTYSVFTKANTRGGLLSNEIFCLHEDRKGNLWIGTNGEGVNIYQPEINKFSELSKNAKDSTFPRLPLNGYIRAIEEDKQGNLWIGSHGTGIAIYNPQLHSVKVLNKNNSKLSSNVILSLYCDSQGNIWVGTLGAGLNKIEGGTGRILAFSENNGLANSTVHAILEDANGLIWISTNAGLSSLNVQTKKFKNYGTYNGLVNSTFTMGAALKTAVGTMYFGSLEGFNFFNKEDIKTNKNIPPVIFTDLKVSNKSILPEIGGIIEKHISVAEQVNLDYKQNFSVSYIAMNYTVSQQNQYAYLLEGFEKDWNFVGTGKTAAYTNLSPGEYVLRVKASNNDGVWNQKGTEVKIIVHPPFWMTIYAYVFYAATAIGFLLYLRHRGVTKLKNDFLREKESMEAKQLVLAERKEAEKNRELDQLKIKFLTNLSHEFRTPISLVLAPIEDLLKKELSHEALGKLTMVKRNARRLLNLVNQLLDFRKMEEHELQLCPEDGDLILFLREITESFNDLAARKNIRLFFKTDVKVFYTRFDHDKIERIFFNLLSNAFKFTLEKGTVSLEVEMGKSDRIDAITWLAINVKDNGIGIPENQRERIFDRFFQHETNVSILNQGTGIGLSITHEFVKMHGGSIQVIGNESGGSTFALKLPFESLEPVYVVSDIRTHEAPDLLEGDTFEEEQLTSPDIDLGMPTVLLVEDNDDFRLYLKDNLKQYYQIIEAVDGKQGWQKALASHPQLIVSDISMPNMDGVELSKKIKLDKRTSHIPLILLTAASGDGEMLRGLDTGANDYLTKPFNFEILNLKIRNLLLSSHKLKETYSRQVQVLSPEMEIESENQKLLNKVVLYIENNLNDSKLSVADLSDHVNMSRGSLYNKLLEVTGQTPIEYIRNVKLEKAAVLLEKGDYYVAQVAYMVGFATPNYFAKSFKHKYGMLPSEYVHQKRQSS
ncbi:response regulator [Pedobacter sp. MC2016-14]|uniref:hybrid sensor histidine kinase/response regulator transcription factor n=1 Tax=Pedobacter sp. MC2016-14 TaxID=2897327 RepID=UPI001E2AC28B|nr:hybrid sensor histidine kinase/response regulator transcription factor [Pedobacter sp. MC2016-14]MCD0489171.1 response regulator [Pedobacter sp. MC2016-14]